jgi:outer membrane protein assembly factor BamB
MPYRESPRPTRLFFANRGCLRAIDASKGDVAWLYKNLPMDGRVDVVPHVDSSGAERVVVGAAAHLAYLDAATGRELWALKAPRVFTLLVIAEGIVVVGNGEMRCISFGGALVWRRTIDDSADRAEVEPRLPFTFVQE